MSYDALDGEARCQADPNGPTLLYISMTYGIQSVGGPTSN